MDKSININIAGTLFQIDEEAFRILRDYLQALNNRFRNVQGGHETVEDIESRIAEIFQSQKGLAGIITKENVEAMILVIGKPDDFDHYDTAPEQKVYTSHSKRMYRNPDDKILGGVCGGLGAYLGTDPVIFRILFVLFIALFGTGVLLYLVLWIALPEANTDLKRREMHGRSFHSASSPDSQTDNSYSSSAASYDDGYHGTSRLGNAFNEIFRAVGKVLFVCVRIFLILLGVIFVLTGFFTILALLMIFVFRFPWAISADGFDPSLIYLPDLLNYIVNPSVAPWIVGLALLAIILPMIAFIYWGVKMIFWFKAKDGIINLAGFVLWAVVVTTLAIILFNEGISFSESAKTTTQTIITSPPDTLYVTTDHKISDLKFDRKFSLPEDDFTVFLADSAKNIFVSPRLRLIISDKDNAKVEISKRSSSRTSDEAARKSETLIYNYRLGSDTLFLDEYFTIPSGRKWTADFVSINLSIPEKTVLYFDSSVEKLFHRNVQISTSDDEEIDTRIDYVTKPWEMGNRYWTITPRGLREAEKVTKKR